MKKNIITSISAAATLVALNLCAVSCTEKYSPAPDPDVPEGGQYLFKAEVEDFTGTYIWSESGSIAGVYAGSDANEPFVLRKEYEGKSGEVEIYGKEVRGTAYACLPRTEYGTETLKEGRIPLPSVQAYTAGWKSQITENCILAAAAKDGKFTFRYPCGALKISLKIEFSSPVRSVILTADQNVCGNLDISGSSSEKLTDASKSVAVTGINLPCSISSPLDIWVMLPEGNYTGLFVNVVGDDEAITARLDGSCNIERCKESVAQASEENHNYGTSDFEEEKVKID